MYCMTFTIIFIKVQKNLQALKELISNENRNIINIFIINRFSFTGIFYIIKNYKTL